MIKIIILMFFTCFVMSIAQTPSFQDGGKIAADGEDVLVGHGCPCVVDWDGDGKKDLLIGQFYDENENLGQIRLYLNYGPASAPEFTSFSFLKAEGADIALSTG